MTTNDLVKRARNFAHLEDTDAHGLVEELADEIERLREALEAIKEAAYDGETVDCFLIALKALEGSAHRELVRDDVGEQELK